jgi:hypothetical protein
LYRFPTDYFLKLVHFYLPEIDAFSDPDGIGLLVLIAGRISPAAQPGWGREA